MTIGSPSRVCQGLVQGLYAAPVTESGGLYRIGELSRRVGVSHDLLRAWERRYGLLQPVRTEKGYRLYTSADERRVRRMQALLTEGLSAAEAARAVRIPESQPTPSGSGAEPSRAEALAAALVSMDEAAAQRELDGSGSVGDGGHRRRRAAVPAPNWGRLGVRRTVGRPRTLREPGAPRQAARTRPRLGTGRGPAHRARLPAGRAARPRPADLRDRSGAARLGACVPGRGLPARSCTSRGPEPRTS